MVRVGATRLRDNYRHSSPQTVHVAAADSSPRTLHVAAADSSPRTLRIISADSPRRVAADSSSQILHVVSADSPRRVAADSVSAVSSRRVAANSSPRTLRVAAATLLRGCSASPPRTRLRGRSASPPRTRLRGRSAPRPRSPLTLPRPRRRRRDVSARFDGLERGHGFFLLVDLPLHLGLEGRERRGELRLELDLRGRELVGVLLGLRLQRELQRFAELPTRLVEHAMDAFGRFRPHGAVGRQERVELG